ncbi:MAG: DUF6268 family outer membrane beta-barrel protein, partial [Bacteroidia bacterium]
VASHCFSQPFVDPVNLSSQFFSSEYKDSTKAKNKTSDYTLNIFLPKEFKNGNALLVRVNAEQLHSERASASGSQSYDLYSLSVPLGFQFANADKKWKFLFVAIPKMNSDFRNSHVNDFQLGGISLITYTKGPNLKFKLGLYYNREFFGNFFVPLVGMDWKVNDRLSFYGVLPTNYRMEIKLSKFMYTGLGFKSFQRSYRLANELHSDFVWVRESGLKAFLDIYIAKKIILFGELGYMLNYRLVQYQHGDLRAERNTNPVYTPFQNNIFFNAGLAFRIRRD